MSLGPVMVDLVGTALSDKEYELLSDPLVGGVILFTRNLASPTQLQALVGEIHALRSPHLLVAVDHEGGRVQRFREGFSRIPPAHALGLLFDRDSARARALAEITGWLLAVELRAVGIDFSFAPVLDLFHGVSDVIGDRAFHRSPEVVAELGHELMRGMRRAGMEAVGKHFPGHGGVKEDSHTAMPGDHRRLEDILLEDMLPFERSIHYGLAGIMPAHVIYSQAGPEPAGYSRFWLQEILRARLGFEGVIFSDDLSMRAAHVAGGYAERACAALEAGCDMVLVCNHPEGAREVIDGLRGYENAASQVRLARMHGRRPVDPTRLRASEAWRQAAQSVTALDESPWLELSV